jgi:hypothetical protein
VTCGACGVKMAGGANSGDRKRQYYRCPAKRHRTDYVRECDLPGFRADQVDAVVWEWVKSLLLDPAALARGLGEHQAERERENAPLRERLRVVGDLIAGKQTQLDRLLDLYLSGEFPKEVLTERKARLETTISALEKERAGLVTRLEARTLTPGEIQSLQDFAAKVGQGLEVADTDFETRRRVIEYLDVQTTLTVEDGQKVAYAQCILRKTVDRCLIPQKVPPVNRGVKSNRCLLRLRPSGGLNSLPAGQRSRPRVASQRSATDTWPIFET